MDGRELRATRSRFRIYLVERCVRRALTFSPVETIRSNIGLVISGTIAISQFIEMLSSNDMVRLLMTNWSGARINAARRLTIFSFTR